jgi:hypothetical protein
MHCILLRKFCWDVKKPPEGGSLTEYEHPSGYGLAVSNSYLTAAMLLVSEYSKSPLHTTGSQLQCVIRDILTDNFIKFYVHIESFII